MDLSTRASSDVLGLPLSEVFSGFVLKCLNFRMIFWSFKLAGSHALILPVYTPAVICTMHL